MTNIVEIEIARALAKVGCGIVRPPAPEPITERLEASERDWMHIASRGNGRCPTLAAIICAVSEATGITTAELKSPRRKRSIVRARMIYFALARRLTSHSFPMIGRSVGDKDHTTVMHGIGKVDAQPAYFEPEMSKLLAAFKREEEAIA